jgi:iron(III) transport system substrate-binding protein
MTVIATMRRAAILSTVALAAVGLSGAALAQKTKITVYTAIENEQLEPFKKAFEADNPAIEIAWVRDSTGVMTAKLIAESQPRADVVGPGGFEHRPVRQHGHDRALHAGGAAALKPMFRAARPGDLGRHGRLPSPCCASHREAEKNKSPSPPAGRISRRNTRTRS